MPTWYSYTNFISIPMSADLSNSCKAIHEHSIPIYFFLSSGHFLMNVSSGQTPWLIKVLMHGESISKYLNEKESQSFLFHDFATSQLAIHIADFIQLIWWLNWSNWKREHGIPRSPFRNVRVFLLVFAWWLSRKSHILIVSYNYHVISPFPLKKNCCGEIKIGMYYQVHL